MKPLVLDVEAFFVNVRKDENSKYNKRNAGIF
jgi:hypothetical protein